MNDNLTYYTDLISRYFAGEATPAEILLISAWVKEEPENKRLFVAYQKTWLATEKSMLDSKLDVNEEWRKLVSLMPTASVNTDPEVVPLLIVRKRPAFGIRNLWKVAAAIVILAVSAAVMFYYFSKPGTVALTADNGNIEQVLPDGSVITLALGSTIEYPEKFTDTREVKLTGEAYFTVTHDKTKPFIVAGENARVEVLGTTFNVNTNAGNATMSVVLTSGKVSLYYENHTSGNVILLPGEMAEISRTEQKITKTTHVDPNYMAWKTGKLEFDNQDLGQVIATLNHVYHADIKIADVGIRNCRITATFDSQPLTSVLNVLKGTLDLQVVEKGKTVELSGKPCQ